MTEQAARRVPTDISLHAKSRVLSVTFDDGKTLELPCEYLRVFSKAAEVRTAGQPVTGKEGINIERIEPQGRYAVRLVFDDGHDTGIYSWDTLYDLGVNKEANWTDYLERLERTGYQRHEPDQADKRLRLLYFSWMAKKMRTEGEQVVVPANVPDVDSLLLWLGRQKKGAAVFFEKGRVRVTVNKQFSEGFTKLHDGDEIGLVPTSPTAPAAPDLV